MIGNNTALLIIDMQKGSFTPETPRYDTVGVTQRINTLSSVFRVANAPVIFIQHDGSQQGEFVPGSHDWEILDELERHPADVVIAKTANDSFYETDLYETLLRSGVDQVCVTGCATDFCVEATIQSALGRNVNIVVISDGHTTAERPHVSAEQVIAHYNWIWANMIPTKGTIQLQTTAAFIQKASQ